MVTVTGRRVPICSQLSRWWPALPYNEKRRFLWYVAVFNAVREELKAMGRLPIRRREEKCKD
jgi:hypothetical protein